MSFGDVVPGNPNGSPARDTDLVGWTSDTELRPGGFTLHPVKAGRFFDPFRVDSGIGILPINRTPTGAFSYGSRAYVFGLWDNPLDPVIPGTLVRFPTTVLASKEDPSLPGAYRLDFIFSKAKFWQVAPVVVKNADHPGLPESQGDGLILLGGGLVDSVYLAWMRLEPGRGPVLSSVRYYTGNPGQPWTPAESDAATALAHEPEAKAVVNLPPHYTSVSAAWLPDIKQWVLLYSRAINDPDAKKIDPAAPVVARFGVDPWSWADEVQIFNTCRDRAYGHFMHWGGIDDINTRVPPNVFGDAAGWAYGAFVMNRFTRWNGAARELSLAYLMSTSNPYQVQVMRTQLSLLYYGDYAYLKSLADRLFGRAVQLIAAQQAEEARPVAVEAVAVYLLAARAPLPDTVAVVQQLLSLSSQWANTSHPAEAVAPAQAAVDVLRDLEPAPGSELVHLSKLAEAWFTLTLRLIEAGRVEEALQPALDTVAIYRRTAATPGADVVSIAQNLIFLSSHLANARQPAAAVAPAQAAVDVLHGLAPSPGAQMAKLAEACHTLALRLKEVGRVREALPPAREGLELYRQLAIADPQMFHAKLVAMEQLVASLEQS